MYKLSQYIVYSLLLDKVRNVYFTIVYSTRTGAFYKLSMREWESIKNYKISEISNNTLSKLQEGKIIVSASEENELDSILKENKEFIKNNAQQLYMVIQPSASCPFGCHYCGQKHTSKQLSSLNQDLILARLEKKLKSGSYRNLKISWFGAEPLVGINVIRKMTPQIIDLCKKYSIPWKFSIVSNGLLLNKEASKQLINNLHLQSIEITLDGDKNYHDKRRHLKSGGGTFDKIYENIKYFLSIKPENVDLTIRCNTDARNKEGISPLLKKLVNDGMHEKISYLYVAPIHSWGNDAHKLSADKKQFAEWEIQWLIEMKELGFNVNFLPKRRDSFCITMVPGHELIDPMGGIYNCTEVSLVPSYEDNGINKYEIDKIISFPSLQENKRKLTGGDFFDKKVIQKYPCSTCSIFPICGGACPKEWIDGRTPCPSMKYNMPERLSLAYASFVRSNKNSLQHTS